VSNVGEDDNQVFWVFFKIIYRHPEQYFSYPVAVTIIAEGPVPTPQSGIQSRNV
jgi:hypothetical protein